MRRQKTLLNTYKSNILKCLVVIPARGGSKGLPDKNIRLLNGKPLINYTIEAARIVFDDSCICVSTDSKKIRKVAEETGIVIPELRPDHLATDTSSTRDVILYLLEKYRLKNNHYPDVVVLLQPTSPLRNDTHIKEALDLYNDDIDMVVSVKETKSNPYYLLFEENEFGFLENSKKGSFLRRQDCPKVWEYNGAIYIINVESLLKMRLNEFTRIVKYEMDSFCSIDIDDEIDFRVTEVLIDLKLRNY